jgi:ferredoxin-NADP reductase
VFSIASAPSRRDAVTITYAVHGAFTQRMERELTEGRQAWIKLPYGDFVVDGRADVALFAGGTGVTAFTAFLEGVPSETPHQVTLAYGARTSDLLIYRDVVERSAVRLPTLQVLYFVEDVSDASAGPMHRGSVSVAVVWPRLARPLETQFYISGPPPMLRSIGDDLRAQGVVQEAIHIDAWE